MRINEDLTGSFDNPTRLSKILIYDLVWSVLMLLFSTQRLPSRGCSTSVEGVRRKEEPLLSYLMASATKIELPGLIVNEDGSTIRLPYPTVPPNPNFEDGVASADVILDAKLDIWVRIFFPEPQKAKNKLNSDEEEHGAKPTSDEEQKDNLQMPVVVYFHGGGFIVGAASGADFHRWCGRICKKLNALVVSVNYRLAPEHRLPAAYDDCFSVLTWLQKIATKQEQLRSDDPPLHLCDFSRVYLMGDSAGGNLAHHVAVRAAQNPDVLQPVKVIGQVPIQPFFGGTARTDSEVRLAQGAIITTDLCDVLWSLSLPESAAGNRDHPFSNSALHLPQILKQLDSFPKTLVVIGGLDLLQDRQVEYAEILKQAGKVVIVAVHQKADHGFYVTTPDSNETLQLLDEMAAFCSD